LDRARRRSGGAERFFQRRSVDLRLQPAQDFEDAVQRGLLAKEHLFHSTIVRLQQSLQIGRWNEPEGAGTRLVVSRPAYEEKVFLVVRDFEQEIHVSERLRTHGTLRELGQVVVVPGQPVGSPGPVWPMKLRVQDGGLSQNVRFASSTFTRATGSAMMSGNSSCTYGRTTASVTGQKSDRAPISIRTIGRTYVIVAPSIADG